MRILIVWDIFRDCSAEVIFPSPAWCRGRSRPPWPRGRACRQRSSSRRAARTARGHTRAQHSHSAQANEKIESDIQKKYKEVSPGGRVTRTAPSPCTRSCPSARAEYFARESIVDGKINVLSRYFFFKWSAKYSPLTSARPCTRGSCPRARSSWQPVNELKVFNINI